MPVGGDALGLLESGLAQHLHRTLAPFRHAAAFRGDRRLPNPILQAAHGIVVTPRDLLVDRIEPHGSLRIRYARRGNRCTYRTTQKLAPIQFAHGKPRSRMVSTT